MSGKTKRIIICSLVTVLFISPIIVFSVMYRSNNRVNSFTPAEAEIKIVESGADNETGDELENEYSLTDNPADDNYSVEKPVRILDERSNSGEELRVCFIPMWYDSEGNVCGGIDGVTDVSEIALDADNKKLIYYNGSGQDKTAAITLYLADGYENNWEYKGDGCFYYSGEVRSDKTTPPLIEKLEVTKAVYDATESYTLQLDVLADALQKSGNAYSDRNWAKYVS